MRSDSIGEDGASERDDAALNADFARFQRSGDPAALARVFDRAAPRLLLVAAHFARDAAEAEDLVQTTFLHAVRDAASWESGRPVAAWLAGILRHRALDLLRARRRRPERELPELPLATAAADPADLAQQRDLFERVVAATRRVEEPFRTVLLMRLVHGLEPTAIAHTLGRPPGTVRMQLKRGLEKLRAALPSAEALLGGAFAAIVVGESARGLAAVREEVLDAGPRATEGAATTGSLATWSAVLGACGVVVAALVVWSVSTREPFASTAPTSAAVHVAAAAATQPSTLAAAEVATRQAVAPPRPPSADEVVVRGRIELEGASDHSGVRLTWIGEVAVEDQFGFTTSAPDPDRPEPSAIVTDADGAFEIVARKGRDITISLRHAGYGALEWGVICDRFTSPLDLGTTVVPREGVLVGQLVDTFGEPVHRAQPIHVMSRELYAPRAPSAVSFDDVLTASDGTFRLAGIAPGEVSVDTRPQPNTTLARNQRFFVRREGETHVELVVDDGGGPPSVAFRLAVHANGITVRPEAASIRLRGEDGATFVARPGTQDGMYEFRGLTPQQYDVVVLDQDWRVPPKPIVYPFDGPWGLTLQPARELVFVVRDAASGKPVVPARVALEFLEPDVRVFGAKPPTYADERLDSTVRARTTSDPQVWWFEAPGFAAHEVRFDDGIDFASQSVVHVDLVPAAPIVGRFVDAGGAPIGDAWVHASSVDRSPAREWRTKTDHDGCFAFDALAPGAYDVCGELHSNAIVVVRADARGDELFELSAPPCGAIDVVFGAEHAHFARTLEFVFERSDESAFERAFHARRTSSRVDHEIIAPGHVRRSSLPLGTYRVGVRRSQRDLQFDNGVPRIEVDAPLVELATVEVREGETSRFDASESIARPPTLAVSIALDGDTSVPVVVLARRVGSEEAIHGAALSRANGVATLDWLAPGAYELELRDADSTWSRRVAGTVVVAPTATTSTNAAVTLATATIRLVDESGAPLIRAQFNLTSDDAPPGWSRRLDTGSVGAVRLTLPTGAWRLSLLGDDGAPTARAVDVQWTADGPTNALLVLPD